MSPNHPPDPSTEAATILSDRGDVYMARAFKIEGTATLWRESAQVRVLLGVFAAQLTISALIILGFCHTFKISKWLVAAHLPLAAGVYFASLFVPGLFFLIRPIRRRKFMRRLYGLVPALCFAFVLLLYAVDYVTYKWLGANINFRQAQIFLQDLIASKHMVPLANSIYLGTAAVAIVVLVTFVALGPRILGGIEALLLPQSQISLVKSRSRVLKSLATLAVLLLAFGGYLYLLRQRAAYSEILSNDPFVSFARNTTGFHDPNYPAYVAKLSQEEQRCRASYSRPDSFAAKNIIIIVGDSMRPDHMSVYGYERPTTPFLQSLYASGQLRRVSFATSTCSETLCGLLSTLDSKLLKRQIPDAFKLQELLQSVGYDSFFILSGNHKGRLEESYGHSMNVYFDGTHSKKYDVNDDRLIFEGLEQVPTRQSKPGFFLFHLMSTHAVGTKQEQFRVYNPSDVEINWAYLHGQINPQFIINSYDNRMLQADAMIKQIFDVLDQKKYLENSIVVILGDHGDSLGERGEFGHIFHLYQEYISIPLLIYDREPVQYSNLDFATQIDIAPTIVDRLKLPIPSCWDGTSLLNPNVRTTSVHQTTLHDLARNQCTAIIDRSQRTTYKYIYCNTGQAEEFYDLTNDPREQNNLINTADPGLIQKLRDQAKRVKQY
jgi:glucan phosphoethanolaminetransferase (alkaline phosphatase superfamily)